MERQDIERVAHLARIELTSFEIDDFLSDITSILGYVSEITKITGSGPEEKVHGALVNVMREDTEPHEAGFYTEDILKAAPEREGQYVKVKKMLDQNT